MAIEAITEAVKNGARQKYACKVIGITSRTLQNWTITGDTDRRTTIKKDPKNKLSEEEKTAILSICNTKEFRSQSGENYLDTYRVGSQIVKLAIEVIADTPDRSGIGLYLLYLLHPKKKYKIYFPEKLFPHPAKIANL
jgi:hypothetical protein